jgi:CHAT domain-containing protein/Tfp pilus assembly protein PilF
MGSHAYAASQQLANDAPAPGVRVLSVDKNSAAEKAGLQKGDIILGWSRGQESGKIETPFDFGWVDIEQRPRGEMVLTGTRAGERKSWVLKDENWSMDTAPVYKGRLLQVFEQTQALLAAGKKLEAAKYWSNASAPLPESSWLPAWSAYYSGNLFAKGMDVRAADSAYQQATALSANLNIVAQARIADRWGYLYCPCDGREYPQAIPHFRASVNLAQASNEGTLLEASYLADLGFNLMYASKIDEAERVYTRSLEIYKKLAPGSFEMSTCLEWLGDLETFAEEFGKATGFLEQALEIQRKVAAGSTSEADTEAALAWIETQTSRLTQAEKHGLRALEIYQRLAPASSQAAAVLVEVAIIENQRGDHSGAVQFVRQAIAVEKQLNSSDFDLAIDYSQLAIFELDLGTPRQGEKDFVSAARLLPQAQYSPDLNYLDALNNLGEYARKVRKFQQAERYLNDALTFEEKTEKHTFTKYETLMQLGNLYLASDNPTRAEQMFQRALPILKQVSPGSYELATVLSSLARIALLKHDQESAENFYEQAISAIEAQTAQLGGSREIRTDYRGTQANYYRDYMDLLIERGKVSEAFNVSERFRAQTLLEILTRATVEVHQSDDPELLERKRKLDAEIKADSDRRMRLLTQEHESAEIKALEESIADLSRKRAEIEALLNASSQDDTQAQFHTLTTQEIQQQLLDKDTVLLEYALGTKHSYVFVVTPQSLTVHELPTRTKIEAAARRIYALLKIQGQLSAAPSLEAQQEHKREYEEVAAVLSKMVLAPLSQEIRNKRLVIVADGALQYVPFAALPDPGSRRSQPLMVDHEIANLPSASVLSVLRQQEQGRTPAPKAVAVLADPVFKRDDPRVDASRTLTASAHLKNTSRGENSVVTDATSQNNFLHAPTSLELLTRSAEDIGFSRHAGLSFPRLLYTREEANEIMKVVPKGSGKKAVDFEASRATATSPELGQYRIVHFATHGLLDSVHPELSGLVFSMVDKHGHPQNGFLELQDIYNLKLPADLVVLSACETGLGKEVSGEGLVGLTRGFMYAGATRVVASLWRVSDVGTAELMSAFYTSMERDNLPPAAALRVAQIKLWKQKRWNDPYYWAAFQIQGEWK